MKKFIRFNKDCFLNLKTIYKMILLIAGMGLFTFLGVKFIKNGFVATIYNLSYEEKSDIDYKVYLKKNNFFEKDYLEKDMQYVASLIDYIDIFFNYSFSSSEELDYNYSYYITGNVIATKPDNNAVLYQKEYVLLENKEMEVKADKYFINENIKINYALYNNIINSFKSDYALSLNSKLEIKLHITTKGDYKNFEDSVDNVSALEIDIPLSEQTINISMDYNEVNNYNSVEEYSRFELTNIIYYVFGGIFILIDVVLVYIYFYLVFKMFVKLSLYTKKINKILREYDRIIVNVNTIPSLGNYSIINVNSFEELVDVSERIEKPILYYIIKKNRKCKFLIIEKDLVYQYIFCSWDLGE